MILPFVLHDKRINSRRRSIRLLRQSSYSKKKKLDISPRGTIRLDTLRLPRCHPGTQDVSFDLERWVFEKVLSGET